MRKTHVVGGLTIFLTLLGSLLFITLLPPHIRQITNFTLKYPFFAPAILILWRIIAIIIPPLPGAVLSFAFIPIIGWFWAYLYSAIGVQIGASLAFFIARKYREPAVARFIPLQQLHRWEDKLSHRTKFFAFLGIRITTGAIMDFISYIAGLSKISFKKFIVVTIIAEIPVVIWYYLGDKAYKQFAQNSGFLGLGILLIAIFIIFYFIKKQRLLSGKI